MRQNRAIGGSVVIALAVGFVILGYVNSDPDRKAEQAESASASESASGEPLAERSGELFARQVKPIEALLSVSSGRNPASVPFPLHREPEAVDDAYRTAQEEFEQTINRDRAFSFNEPQRTLGRSRIVMVNQEGKARFFSSALRQNMEGVESTDEFDLALFSDFECTLSSFDLIQDAGSTWQIRGTCEQNTNTKVSAWLAKETGQFGMTLQFDDGTQHSLVSVKEDYAGIYEFIPL